MTDGFSEQQVYVSKFSDVENGKWYSNYIGFIQDKDIVVGYPDGDFKPNGSITRAEFATIIARFKGLKTDKENPLPFNDISVHWSIKYYNLISTISQLNIDVKVKRIIPSQNSLFII